jgi:hypothetical protein
MVLGHHERVCFFDTKNLSISRIDVSMPTSGHRRYLGNWTGPASRFDVEESGFFLIGYFLSFCGGASGTVDITTFIITLYLFQHEF